MRHRTRKWFKLGLVILGTALLTPASGITQAQIGGTISYGSTVMGTLSPTVSSLTYSFSGSAGDLVSVEVLPFSGTLDPQASVLGPDGVTLKTQEDDQIITGSHDVYFTLVLPQSAVYSIRVSGQGGTIGDFLVTLLGRPPTESVPLMYGVPVQADLPVASPTQHYMFEPTNCPTTLTVSSLSSAELFPFVVRVRTAQGDPVAVLRGGSTLEDRVTVPANSGRYELDVLSDDPTRGGALSLVITCADATPVCACSAESFGVVPAIDDWAGDCPSCPPCETLGEDACPDMNLTTEILDALVPVVGISWNPVPGAEHYMLTIYGVLEDGGQVIVMSGGSTTTHMAGAVPGGYDSYHVVVTAFTADNEALCAGETKLVFQPLGPVEWGPAVDCSIGLLNTSMANGLQTFFWTEAAGAVEYSLRIYNAAGTEYRAGANIAAPATSVTLDTSEAAIGPGSSFSVVIDALSASGKSLCSDYALLSRAPGG